MISVAEALDRVLALARPLQIEEVPLSEAAGRVLARPVAALRDQPPFASSAMDGYALGPGEGPYRVLGTAAAGRGFGGTVGKGQAVRIFTGAPVPVGADRVAIQEEVDRDGDTIDVLEAVETGANIRARASDFRCGDEFGAPRRLKARDVALLAAMNVAVLPVTRRPHVALIATGDELVMPGETPRDDQIVASNAFGLKAMIEAEGAEARLLPIARDTAASLETAFALAEGADLVITIGGASVGDHDLVAPVASRLGLERSFYKIAMRPGKPLMAGRMNDSVMIGLPGNPVSSMVCGTIFVLPLLRAMLGLGSRPAPRNRAPLAVDVAANGPREHYMRARLTDEGLIPFERQDSALLTVLGRADALLIRPVADRARREGEIVEYVAL